MAPISLIFHKARHTAVSARVAGKFGPLLARIPPPAPPPPPPPPSQCCFVFLFFLDYPLSSAATPPRTAVVSRNLFLSADAPFFCPTAPRGPPNAGLTSDTRAFLTHPISLAIRASPNCRGCSARSPQLLPPMFPFRYTVSCNPAC